jgi:hypothetical protein
VPTRVKREGPDEIESVAWPGGYGIGREVTGDALDVLVHPRDVHRVDTGSLDLPDDFFVLPRPGSTDGAPDQTHSRSVLRQLGARDR